ncbi:glycoside hydrolase family 97 C-terminal domain-containing protein [Streptomyces sp. HD]|nr:glycoside hydrolase family 97 C-terminal domain-containing protein [Streptomyces sp. HD]MDC0769593.1 glycoside hydrolase family 97 C-terminal domain-containing protein [Streptomyces sp. HD]
MPWFDTVPTTWDESRTLAGSIGEYVVVARRSGDTWYLGAMTNETSRTLSVPLSFLAAPDDGLVEVVATTPSVRAPVPANGMRGPRDPCHGRSGARRGAAHGRRERG